VSVLAANIQFQLAKHGAYRLLLQVSAIHL
jgi:hypothetical protein